MTKRCPVCDEIIEPLRAPHIAVVGRSVVSYCSSACKTARLTQAPPRTALESPAATAMVMALPPARPWRVYALTLLPLLLGLAYLAARAVALPTAAATETAALAPTPAPPAPTPAPLAALYGPEPAPADFVYEDDAWLHPLAGPKRRLPVRASRRFGVARDHHSPESCREGHCGVDIGEVKDEPVMAIHDGVVERVVREDRDKTGRYVRIAHRYGTVVSQYMHLGEVAPDLKVGGRVRAGDLVGTVGETGVKTSGPHLHFTISTRRSPSDADVYIDPEPLLTLWPLRP